MFEGLDPSTVFIIGVAVGAGGFMLLDTLSNRVGPWLDRRRARQEPSPPTPCPISVLEVVAVPPGQEETVRRDNGNLFTVDDAKRALDLFFPVAKDEREHLLKLLGSEMVLRPGSAHLVRLGRRGFHG